MTNLPPLADTILHTNAKIQHEMIENLPASLTSARSRINDRNIQVKNLSRAVKNHELTVDILEEELH